MNESIYGYRESVVWSSRRAAISFGLTGPALSGPSAVVAVRVSKLTRTRIAPPAPGQGWKLAREMRVHPLSDRRRPGHT